MEASLAMRLGIFSKRGVRLLLEFYSNMISLLTRSLNPLRPLWDLRQQQPPSIHPYVVQHAVPRPK